MSNSTRIVSAIMVIIALVTGVTFAMAPVAADDSTDHVLSGVLSDDDEGLSAGASAFRAVLSGASDRAWYYITHTAAVEAVGEIFPSLAAEQNTAADEAKAVTTYWRANNATLEAYANERGNWTSDHVVELSIHLEDETATRYLIATSSNGNLSTEIVSSTNRTVTDDVHLCGFAADQAYEELQYFTEEYAEPDEDVDKKYLGRLKGRYGDDVETSLYPSSGDCGGNL